jgi:hypothetical protein
MRICLTFDVDLVDHAADRHGVDEFADAVPRLQSMFTRHPSWRATWFVRADDQIAALYGDPFALHQRHAPVLAALRDAGHEIGWHPHSYSKQAGKWVQNTADEAVADELRRLAPPARALGLDVVRTGWGHHTNRTMRVIAEAGFKADSSAMPRPRYAFEQSVKDWTTTPATPYYPSIADYRVPGQPALPVLEVPISMGVVRAPYDQGDVVRYLNLAFHEAALAPALAAWCRAHDYVVTITHPYELVPSPARHGLIAFDVETFERNVTQLEAIALARAGSPPFVTMSELASAA